MLAVAPLPAPVTVTRLTPLKVKLPLLGVYPIPLLMIFNPIAVPANPARLPVAFVPACITKLPTLRPPSAIVVPIPTLASLEVNDNELPSSNET